MSPRTAPCGLRQAAVLSVALCAGIAMAQAGGPGVSSGPVQKQTPPAAAPPAPPAAEATAEAGAKQPGSRDRKRAARLYLQASKLYVNSQFEEAMHVYQQAAELDPSKTDYRLAIEVARNHAVTALIQTAAKDRLGSNAAGAREALAHALELDPKNPAVTQHLFELGEDAVRGEPTPVYAPGVSDLGSAPPLLAAGGVRSFHLHGEQRQLIGQIFQAYGVTAMLDDSVRSGLIRLDLDEVPFAKAVQALELTTNTFYIPLDAHRVLVARDTRENRQKFTRQEMETIYLPGLSDTDLTEVGTVAKSIFGIQQTATNTAAHSMMLRAPARTLEAFNATMRDLAAGRDQVFLDVRLIQLANTNARNTGVQPPQTFTAFNLYAEEQSILNANQSLVQQIISSGLASPGNTLAILGILLASGQIPSSLFSGGIATFGGGLTASALSPGPATFNLNLNSSETRELDDIQVRLGDGEDTTFKEGSKYPIQTSSYSSLSGSMPNIPGLTGAGASGSLTSLLASLSGTTPSIPMIQYQDLGLSLKVTPKVLRNHAVALSVEMKIDSLSGSSVNGNPILDTRSYSGVVTLKEGEAVEVVSELDQSQSHAISGTPGLGEIPGLNSSASKNVQKNYAKLLILMTPHVIRSTQPAGHTPILHIEKNEIVIAQ